MAVIGSLEDVLRRNAQDERILRGLRYLQRLSPDFLAGKETGHQERVELDGENLVALHQVYTTRDPADARYEAHRRYADLQFLISGRERIRVASLGPGVNPGSYDADKDVAFFPLGEGMDLALGAGMVAVLYPEDLHAPGLHWGAPQTVRKTVVKVRL